MRDYLMRLAIDKRVEPKRRKSRGAVYKYEGKAAMATPKQKRKRRRDRGEPPAFKTTHK
jgi:hypothetical protein